MPGWAGVQLWELELQVERRQVLGEHQCLWVPEELAGMGWGTVGGRAGCLPGSWTRAQNLAWPPWAIDQGCSVLSTPFPPTLISRCHDLSLLSGHFLAQAKPWLLKSGPQSARLTSSGSFLEMQALGSPQP